MHTPIDIALVSLYAVVWVIVETVRLPKTRAHMAAAPLGARARYYVITMILQWSLAALVFARLLWGHVPLSTIGLVLPHGVLAWAVTAVALALVLWGTEKQAQATRTERGRAAIARALENMAWMLPRERREFATFSALSLTAGVCEEVLFRGHLLAVLDSWMSVIVGTLVGATLFGVAHAYQGKAGIVRTGLVGLFMALVYRGSGSLLAPIVAHALIDYRSGRMIEAGIRHGLALEVPKAAAATAPAQG